MRSKRIIDKTEVVAENGIVAAMHPLAAEAGMEILQQGGNAADAAVATAFAVGVVEPFMSGLGGLAYIVVHHAASDRTVAIDGSVALPAAARDDMFELVEPPAKGSGVYGWRATVGEASESGYRSVAVPGAVAAYTRLLRDFGTMSLSQVMAPAIRLATEGFLLDWYVFANCASALSRLRAFPETMSVFYRPDGTPFLPVNHDDSRPPDRLVQPDLARSLRLIAEQGPDAFYRGEIAHTIAQYLSDHGGIIGEQDLADYRERVREPLYVDYRDKRVAMVPESTGGPTVAEALNILEGFDLSFSGYNTAISVHWLAEAIRMAFADRLTYLADVSSGPVPLEALQSKEYAAARRALIDPARGPVAQPAGDPWPYQPGGQPSNTPLRRGSHGAEGHTTHMTVIDRDRNMVALTASLGRIFASGVVVPGTGIVLNNGFMWFDPEPGSINSIGPGKRSLSASTPALVFDERGPLMALGAPGGRKVITAVLQVMLHVLDFGMGIQGAISAPRIHCETGPIHADVRLPEDVVQELRRIGHEVTLREETFLSSYFARPNGVLIDRRQGVLRGGVEPYKVSTAIGW
jgi:gamma-glutamyltranspeptidase/glutathione hydrolase